MDCLLSRIRNWLLKIHYLYIKCIVKTEYESEIS